MSVFEPSCQRYKCTCMRGWTLSELLVSLAILAVLASLALPAYNGQLRQARRSDAHSALQKLQLDQARWRSTHESHASDLQLLGWSSDLSPAGHYRLNIEEASAHGYTLTATPIGAQAEDKNCQPIRLQVLHSATVVLSSGAEPTNDPGRCWRQ